MLAFRTASSAAGLFPKQAIRNLQLFEMKHAAPAFCREWQPARPQRVNPK
jgi:hypothetical protein